MSDITERLRKWASSVTAVPATDLMDEAADEIERLRAVADRRGELAVERRREIAELRQVLDHENTRQAMRIDPDTCRDHDLLAAEVRRLRAVIADGGRVAELEEAIRRLAEQDATLSVCDGNVTVTMDATLTDAEREAIKTVLRRLREGYFAGRFYDSVSIAAVIDGLLERLGGGK